MRSWYALLFIAFLALQPLGADASLLTPKDRVQHKGAENLARPESNEFWMAVVGDSSVTGAATDSSFIARWSRLLRKIIAFGLIGEAAAPVPNVLAYPSAAEFQIYEPMTPPTRVMYSMQEYDQAAGHSERIRLNVEAKVSVTMDTPEYSFGYMVGQALGINPRHIVFTGQDGKKIETLYPQMERIFEVGVHTLPPLVLISYVANDFCHPDYFEKPAALFSGRYQQSVHEQLSQVRDLPAHPRGTRLVFLAPLDVARVLTDPDLLEQEIPFQNAPKMTCGAMRKGQIPRSYSSRTMYNTLVGECRGVLTLSRDPDERAERIRELQRAQLEILKTEIAAFNRAAPRGLSAEVALSIKDISFQKGDLANDCFHPGVGGHTRIARQLLSHELRDLKKNHHP